MQIKNALKLGGKILLIALILQFIVAGSAFAFYNIDFGDGSSWFEYEADSDNWWEDAWQDDHSPSQDSWSVETETDDSWWKW